MMLFWRKRPKAAMLETRDQPVSWARMDFGSME